MKTTSAPIFGPYSPIRQAGNVYFISGQVGVNPKTKTAHADIATQTKQALDNLMCLLDGAGLTAAHVVKTTIFLTDMADFGTVNDIYMQYFPEPRPARSAVGVQELPRVGGDVPIRIEIEAMACNPS